MAVGRLQAPRGLRALAGVVIDRRPTDHVAATDAEVFGAMERACERVDWRYRLVHTPLHAAVYPETVRLACVMVSPHWTAVAAPAYAGDRGRFYAEVARQLNLSGYRPASVVDPLARWVAREAQLALPEVRMTLSTGRTVAGCDDPTWCSDTPTAGQ